MLIRIILLFSMVLFISTCSTSEFSPNKILPGRWEGISKKGKIIVLHFKPNKEVELVHGRLRLSSVKGKRKVMYELNQSVTPNRIRLVIFQHDSAHQKPKELGLIYKILSPDTMLIAISLKAGEYPESFSQVSPNEKTILVKQLATPK